MVAAPRLPWAAGALTQTFFGGLGGVSASSGAVTLAGSGMQAAGFVMKDDGLDILEGGFLRFFAIATAGLANPSYLVSYALAAGQVTVSLPASACPSNSAVTLQAPSPVPAGGGQIQVVPGTAVSVLACPDPTRPVTVSYSGLTLPGFDRRRLKIAVYNETSRAWIALHSSWDSAEEVLTATVNHLTTFAVVQSSPSVAAGSVLAYPNPFRAARGDLGITFINLPSASRLRVYTLRGEEVKELAADASGQAFWDATNRSGATVASGVYFVHIQGGAKPVTIKVGVQR